MEILQLSTLQLEERIDQELEKNPVLELDMDTSEPAEQGDGSDFEEPEAFFEHEPEMRLDVTTDSSPEEFQIADDFARNYSDTIDELPARSQNWIEEQNARRNDAFANIASRSRTLQDYLTEQLGWFDLPDDLRDMAERIVNNLDAIGYFPFELVDFLTETVPSDAEENAGVLNTQPTAGELHLAAQALELVRKLDPPGVGARNLKDCLLLQLGPASSPTVPHAEVLRVLIASHLEDISSNRLPLVARTTGFSLETLQEALVELRRLNPRPGADFAAETSMAIVPDVIVEKNEDGRYVVRLEEGRSQFLHVNGYYRDMMKNRDTDKGTRDYIRHRIGSAQWLIEAIQQRRVTLQKVAQAIVDHQLDFFEVGPHALKPLKMQQIADLVGIHLTTVSRACDEKWMATPQGLKLREIIDKEDKSNPLSDDALVKLLTEVGIQVARRTVVKYRQLMNIPSSRGRKNWT